ncbi:16582_t:CDS:2 [Funneliformis mosseae]|uniref:16582_t:CDS:1 n=1 Tax=Funneliformis mosseae TaxID=27381 RepID=A0A9N9G5I9_FUNMO|nr:16582_t:CDS:2 [Funneliformis mosseae]
MVKLIEVFRSLINDYEETFQVMENGTIKANNESFKRYIEVDAINIEIISYRQIEKVNRNKKEMVKLLSSVNQLYLKAC